ncbi:MAG: hypothetical protein ACT4RN_22905 [Pseudonocardia sp.]
MHVRSPRLAVSLALAAALATGAAAPTGNAHPHSAHPHSAGPHSADSGTAHWTEDLTAAEASGVLVDAAGARLDPAAPGANGTEQLGLLVLAPHTVPTGAAAGADRVSTAVTGEVPAGSGATVDVRGRRADGDWTEWVPADEAGEVTLPEPAAEVQGRLVLTGTAAAGPVVRAVDLTAHPARSHRITVAQRPALGYRVFATREGLVGGTTANGHVIEADDLFVALPSRRALAPRGTGDYSVRVCTVAAKGKKRATRCAYAPVWDVGPWNTRDDYWNPTHRRQEWRALPQGVPQAQVAHLDGFNGGRDQYDREVLNPAGIDLSDAVFHDALRLDDNGWVRVDYLWTGSAPLGTVTDGPVPVRAGADDGAPEVGAAARRARVPADCRDGDWLRIGDDQYVPADAVTLRRTPPACAPAATSPTALTEPAPARVTGTARGAGTSPG